MRKWGTGHQQVRGSLQNPKTYCILSIFVQFFGCFGHFPSGFVHLMALVILYQFLVIVCLFFVVLPLSLVILCLFLCRHVIKRLQHTCSQ